MVKDTNLPQIIFNKLSKQKYQELRANNQLDPNQFYITPDELDEEKYNIKYSQITNCITKIPQDIKLELNNGTLTLKAGSKVYVPNGVGKFNVVTITRDILNDTTGAGEKMFLSVYNNGASLLSGYTTGGTVTERPVSPINHALYYNTTTNKVEFYDGSTWISNCSFPISLYTRGSKGATSIDQVFNGFGYIGSTIFALPGVEGLIPNGRNTDSSLNNTKFKTSRVLSQTNESTYKGNLAITSTSFVASSYTEYNEDENFNKTSSGENYPWCFCGGVARESGRITSFNPKNTFQAIDRNDTEWLSGLGMPDYSAGISITSYTSSSNQFVAPCDGVLIFTLNISTSGERIYIDDVLIALPSAASSAKLGNTYSFTIGKGQKFYVSPGSFYTAYGINAFLPFKGVN